MLDIRPARLDHPDALLLDAEVQRYYVEIYGVPDRDPLDVDEFAPPRGQFLIAYDRDSPVAMGGWTRRHDSPDDAKVRRMYVRPAARRLGCAAAVLDALEADARAAGLTRMVLETGEPQQDAVRFYRSRGYTDIERFGYYADEPRSVHLGKPL